ncbi:pyridoxamine 5'-phosphate oxidase family protein [Pseudonocardia acaciae]|uniref:pyridoxamine 5'-phosphate oxidase family protein n=1 Tax=Pseudonocardia acaciae TaxID=551276 RepID=UPI000559E883|nr:pyridoxamine 5'-phosphate oxidase family protein [Pseudonocardia acaciae]
MLVDDFAAIEDDFVRMTTQTVFCTATTVDPLGRPRNRMLHPIFVVRDGRPVGWAVTGRTPVKTRHLAANPHLACAFWNPTQDTVFVDCVAAWVTDDDEKRRVFDLFLETPTPLGWGADGMAGFGPERWRHSLFTPLRLDPWRVQVMAGAEYPSGELAGRVWRRPPSR